MVPGPQNKPFRYRLSRSYRHAHGIRETPLHGCNKHTEHWLGMGDIWLAMTFAKGEPSMWRTDVDHQFDVMCEWCGTLLLIEYQRTPITARRWAQKWEARKRWYKAQTWTERPVIVLVDVTGQQESTVRPPKGTLWVKEVEDVTKLLPTQHVQSF